MPSSLQSFKANSPEGRRAKQGHPGQGRSACSGNETDEIRRVELSLQCPGCGGPFGTPSLRVGTVIDIEPVVVKHICYELERRSCPHCQKSFQSQVPDVLPKTLLSNRPLNEIVGEHYLKDAPLSSLLRRFGLNLGTVIETLHRLGRTFQVLVQT